MSIRTKQISDLKLLAIALVANLSFGSILKAKS